MVINYVTQDVAVERGAKLDADTFIKRLISVRFGLRQSNHFFLTDIKILRALTPLTKEERNNVSAPSNSRIKLRIISSLSKNLKLFVKESFTNFMLRRRVVSVTSVLTAYYQV